jgi:hypothetical protein
MYIVVSRPLTFLYASKNTDNTSLEGTGQRVPANQLVRRGADYLVLEVDQVLELLSESRSEHECRMVCCFREDENDDNDTDGHRTCNRCEHRVENLVLCEREKGPVAL